MDETRKAQVRDSIEALNDLLDSKQVVKEAEELLNSESLRGVLSAVLMSLGMQGVPAVDSGQISFAIGWALGRLELEGVEDVVGVTRDFPSDHDVMDVINEELSIAVKKHFETLAADATTWNKINWEEELLQ